MKKADDEELSFIHIAALTANVVRYLETNEDQNEQSKHDPTPDSADEKKRDQDREYITHRLNELRAWERKISERN